MTKQNCNTTIYVNIRKKSEISLRSPRSQKFIGEMPHRIANLGIILTLFIFAAIIIAICLIPYPYSHGESILSHLLFN